MIILLKTLSGKKLRLIVDGTILPVANVNRARTQRIKRFAGGVFWAKRKRNIYSQHYKGRVKWEELYYGVLLMVLCDETGGDCFKICVNSAILYNIPSKRIIS